MMAIYERFWRKVVKREDGCWEWTGARLPAGYGIFNDENYKTVTAHRWAYRYIGKRLIKPRLQLDHICRNKWCVNPEHLRQVTAKQNSNYRLPYQTAMAARVACKYGHPYIDGSYKIRVQKNGYRFRWCLVCHPPRVLKTHCKRGHEFTEENTKHRSDGARECIECRRTVWQSKG